MKAAKEHKPQQSRVIIQQANKNILSQQSPNHPKIILRKQRDNKIKFLTRTNLIQCVIEKDTRGERTKQWYKKEIDETGTKTMVDAVIFSSWKENCGIFLSDKMADWHHITRVGTADDVMRLILPNLNILKNYESSYLKNGLTMEDNCKLIVLHELTHLKHANANLKVFANPMYAQTFIKDFSNINIVNTITNLINNVEKISCKSGMHTIVILDYIKNYLYERLGYILQVYHNSSINSEAPAVLHELKYYLFNIINFKSESLKKLGQFDTLKQIYKAVINLDRLCTNEVNKMLNNPTEYLKQYGGH